MAKSEYSVEMDEIMEPISIYLKEQGFRKSARNFNRRVEDGLIQVLSFQMGRYEFGVQEIPGLRYNLHGKFTVNLGVLIPGILLAEGFGTFDGKKVYNEGYCSIQTRLGHLMPAGGDAWWGIEEPFPPISREVLELTIKHGLPFLGQFHCNSDVVGYFEKHHRLPGLTDPRCRLIVGLLYHAMGNAPAAIAAFRDAQKLADKNAAFVAHVALIESRLLGT